VKSSGGSILFKLKCHVLRDNPYIYYTHVFVNKLGKGVKNSIIYRSLQVLATVVLHFARCRLQCQDGALPDGSAVLLLELVPYVKGGLTPDAVHAMKYHHVAGFVEAHGCHSSQLDIVRRPGVLVNISWARNSRLL